MWIHSEGHTLSEKIPVWRNFNGKVFNCYMRFHWKKIGLPSPVYSEKRDFASQIAHGMYGMLRKKVLWLSAIQFYCTFVDDKGNV